MRPIIRVQDLGKQYRFGRREAPYATLRESLSRAALAPLRWFRGTHRRSAGQEPGCAAGDTFWALRDVGFEVTPGEVVGIIGRNGAGKSTLLKVLSRITEPTTGRAELYGRVGSLLEVGTGFHPELSGRENVFLNGAVLGMRRHEVARKFDEIVDFAEIERFIDTPVKRYSSGMQMRLAFAVAAHLEPEVLVIDEVLAVGDAEFQKKCLDRMRRLSRGDRTILFVSHNMSALRHICSRAIALERGRLVDEGPVDDVVNRYLARKKAPNPGGCETAGFRVHDVSVTSTRGPVIKTFDPVRVTVRFTPKFDVLDPGVYIGFLTAENMRISGLDFKDFHTTTPLPSGQPAELGFDLEALPLLPGSYQVEVHLKDMSSHRIEFLPETYDFDVVETPVYGGRKLDHWYGRVALKVAHTLALSGITSSGDQVLP